MPGPDPDIPAGPASSLVPNPDDPRLAVLTADPDLPLPQVKVAPSGIIRVIPDPGQLRHPDTSRPEHRDDRIIPALSKRPALAGPLQF